LTDKKRPSSEDQKEKTAMKKTTTPERLAFLRSIASKGGNKTKKQQLAKNPNYYQEIGTAGGLKLKGMKGKDYYSKLGKMSAKNKTEITEDGYWGGDA
jgi:general stress protein YciG